ncbi:hypothetical protein AMJ52_08065 [candidate division TA06 bacterium DG_78]|uniref:DUF72 domain-containing protein n=1 Tax=candidate division TA06 bacterium DG_78 TaxID=1703772 RepID=A0A0S7YC51_UNCT6|nr:MAG: hypothetical protein AMJ52_08065 [candidate division TA06 bacterium DG_78]
MKIFVGTSGWYYEWNKDLTLDWYIAHSGLNAIELNASFYRFPFPNQVKAWARKGKMLHWVIKVNRLITHQFKFSTRAVTTWQRFNNLFSEMHAMIDYFLFQLPPNLSSKTMTKIENFLKKTKVIHKCALEPRHESWFTNDVIAWAQSLGITWVSIDAPVFTRDVFKTTDTVYVRIHGRTDWYRHNYTDKELREIGKRVYAVKPKTMFMFFNNNHNMLKNAQKMKKIMETIGEK